MNRETIVRNLVAFVGGFIVVLGVVLYTIEGFIRYWPYSGILAVVGLIVVCCGAYVINKDKEEV